MPTRRKLVAALTGVFALCLVVVAAALAGFQPIDQQLKISQTGGKNDGLSALDPQAAFNPELKQYLVVWRSDVLSDGHYEVFGQRLSLTGAKLGSRFRISNTTDAGADRTVGEMGVEYNPQANQYLVVWWGDGSTNDNEFEIWGQLVSDTGATVGSDFPISNAADSRIARDGDASGPALAYNSSSNQYLVTWNGDEGTTNNELEIWGQRISAAGAEVGSDFRISDVGTDGDVNRGPITSTHKPEGSVAYNPQTNEYLVAWPADDLATDNKGEIFGQRLDASGNEVGTNDFRISNTGQDTDAGRDATSVDLAYDSHDNQYLAVFNADRLHTGTTELASNNEEEVFGQRLSATGAQIPTSADFRISKTGPDGDTFYDSNSPSVAYGTPSDEYLVAWTSDAIQGQDHIFGQHLGGTANKIGSNFKISKVEGTHLFPEVVRSRSAREYMTAWEASTISAPDYEVYARRIGQSATCAGKLATRQGTSQKDTINGGSSADVIALLGAKDVGNGGGGNDYVCGGGGTGDTVRGNGGNDFLDGGPGGGDKCIGGAGTDTFAASCETKVQ
jgi:hypothetical protein